MGKIINIIDKNNVLIASISDENVILHNDYRVVETSENEACFRDTNGAIEIKPEVSI